MGSTTHSIVVNAPLRVVYNQWTQFEEFPLFMEGVEEVRQEGDKRLLWKAKIAGKDKQWEAEITEQVPDKRIAWVSVDGTPNAGEVTFDPMESERTLITLTMEYEPEGFGDGWRCTGVFLRVRSKKTLSGSGVSSNKQERKRVAGEAGSEKIQTRPRVPSDRKGLRASKPSMRERIEK
jgi:uncharacterized membrane protein